jgi:hypothetical protein
MRSAARALDVVITGRIALDSAMAQPILPSQASFANMSL